MQPIEWGRAAALADHLSVSGLNDIRIFERKDETLSYREAMSSLGKINDLLAILEPNVEDMLKVRLMLACELHLGAREHIVYRLINAHETLFKELRIDPILADLPAYAVWLNNKAPRVAGKHISGTELQNVVNSALFGSGHAKD
jgi:hypothetical protein